MTREEELANLCWFVISVIMLWYMLEIGVWPSFREWRKRRPSRRRRP